ncbi:Transposase and inactivated derivatives, TnpA family [Legionella sainthelensi]|nr:Transposase and inactivated derivatives, TnpA family [Legionella sainthelensi]
MRLFGQLLDNPNSLDTRIIGHACKLLGLDIVGTVVLPMRDATKTDYKKSIFSHLNFKPFNESKALFYDWLQQKIQTGMLIPEKLIPEAEAFLIISKVALPTLYYLKREINSFCSKHQEKIFTGIHQHWEKIVMALLATSVVSGGSKAVLSSSFSAVTSIVSGINNAVKMTWERL